MVVPIRTSPPDVMRSLSVLPVCNNKVELFIFPVTFPVTLPIKLPVKDVAVTTPTILIPDK